MLPQMIVQFVGNCFIDLVHAASAQVPIKSPHKLQIFAIIVNNSEIIKISGVNNTNTLG